MDRLIFIYNASKHILSNIPDALRKATGGAGACTLCNITWAPFWEKPSWRKFRKQLPFDVVFLHTDDQPEDVKTYLATTKKMLPIVLREKDGHLSEFISSKEIDACNGEEQSLMRLVNDRL